VSKIWPLAVSNVITQNAERAQLRYVIGGTVVLQNNGDDSLSLTAKVTTVSVQCIAPWTGTKQLGVAGADTVSPSVATDVSGNVYESGFTTDGLDGNALTGSSGCFVAKYNSGGVRQ
jgi:hypothetical protein